MMASAEHVSYRGKVPSRVQGTDRLVQVRGKAFSVVSKLFTNV